MYILCVTCFPCSVPYCCLCEHVKVNQRRIRRNC